MSTVVVVGILFKMVVMVVREMWKDEFETDFNDDDGDDEADIGFDIDMPDKVNNGRD